MERQIEVNGVMVELTEDQVKKILEQTKIKVRKELVKQEILEILEKYKSNVNFLDENYKVSKYPSSRFEILIPQWLCVDRAMRILQHRYLRHLTFH